MECDNTLYFKQHEGIITSTLESHDLVDVKLIGKGGYALVCSCYSKKYDQEFALKVFPKNVNKSIFLSFEKEIKLLLGLDHPNIIRIYKEFSDKYFAYILMELCDGGSLLDKIENGELKKKEKIMEIAHQLSLAIQHCHQHNVVHRDIKPHNVLFDRHGRVRLTDFGISEICPVGELINSTKGTLAFMSPESLDGKYFDPYAADMWSLGITIHYMLEGRVPWESRARNDIIREIQQFSYGVSLDRKFEVTKIIVALLKNSPKARITANDLVKMLEPNIKRTGSATRLPTLPMKIQLKCGLRHSSTNVRAKVKSIPPCRPIVHKK